MPATIPKEEIKSMVNKFDISFSSYPYGNYSLTIDNQNNIHLRSASRHDIFPLAEEKIVDGSLAYGMPTSWEDRGFLFRNWLANANDNKPNANDYIPRISDVAGSEINALSYIEGIALLGIWLPHENDTKVSLYSTPRILDGAVDINYVGREVSKLENFRQKFKSNLLFNDLNQLHYDISKWVEFLDEEGVKIVENPFLGLGIERGEFIAAFYPGKRYLVAESNFHERAKKWASEYGLRDKEAVEAMERFALLHELSHAYGIKGNRKGERLQGILQGKFYTKIAKELQGTKWERIYNKLAEVGNDYAQHYSFLNYLWNEITKQPSARGQKNIEILIKKLEIEAKAYGKEGGELLKYVEDRITNIYSELIGAEPSYKSLRLQSKSQKSQSETGNEDDKSESQKGIQLEQIVQSSDKQSRTNTTQRTITVKGKVYKVEGNVVYLNKESNSRNQRADNKESTSRKAARKEEAYKREQKSNKTEESNEPSEEISDSAESSDSETAAPESA